VTALETFRCPTCLFVLADSGQRRCPACNKRLKRRGRPIVLGDQTGFGSHEPIHVDLALAERLEAEAQRKRGNGRKEKTPKVTTLEAETPKAKTVRTKPVKTKAVRTKRRKTRRGKTTSAPLVASVAASVEAQLVDTSMLDTPLVVSPPLVVPAAPPDAPPIDAEPRIAPHVASAPVSAPVASEPVAPVADESDGIEHTTIFAPSQFDPEMRQTLDSLYRKARSKSDD
jgi:hypothetical protein